MELFEARLDNYLLNILDINDTIDTALASHEFMNTNGAKLDPQGLHAHTIKFKAYFFANSINLETQYISPTYANHFNFINLITDNASHTLIHPKYGTIEGYCKSLNVVHDDTQDYCAIEIEFIQKDIQQNSFISDSKAIDSALNQQQADLLNAQNAAIATSLTSMGMGSILGKTINSAQSLVSQFNNVTTPVRDFLKSVDGFLQQCDELLKTVEEPFNTVIAAVNFVNDVPSRITSSINSCTNRIIGSCQSLLNSPATFMNNVTLGITNFMSILSGPQSKFASHDNFFTTKFLTISAGSVAWQTGLVFQTDENNRKIQTVQEKKSSFDANGNRINIATINIVMSLNDIESVLYNTRQLIQQVIIVNRQNGNDVTQLKQMSVLLTDFTNQIKLNSRTVKTIQTSNMPLHVLVTQLGLSYNAAERVLQLNPQIKCPNFVEGNVSVYVS